MIRTQPQGIEVSVTRSPHGYRRLTLFGRSRTGARDWSLRISRTRSFYIGAGRHPDAWWLALGVVLIDYVRFVREDT